MVTAATGQTQSPIRLEGRQAGNAAFSSDLYLGCHLLLGSLPPRVNSWECPHRPAQTHISYLTLDPVKLTELTITANTITIKYCFDNVNDN